MKFRQQFAPLEKYLFIGFNGGQWLSWYVCQEMDATFQGFGYFFFRIIEEIEQSKSIQAVVDPGRGLKPTSPLKWNYLQDYQNSNEYIYNKYIFNNYLNYKTQCLSDP